MTYELLAFAGGFLAGAIFFRMYGTRWTYLYLQRETDRPIRCPLVEEIEQEQEQEQEEGDK